MTLALVVGGVAAIFAGLCAFLITYDEYQKHFPDREQPLRMALKTAFVCGAFFGGLLGLATLFFERVVHP
jgi:uncharacterized membrane protein YoaK (UPF0700 family)